MLGFSTLAKQLFGSANERKIRPMWATVAKINALESRFVGMSDEESQSLLAMLNAHATSPEFVYRHRWSVGDVVMWDNRCSCHVALGDFDQTKPRVMYRCSLEGEVVSGRLADDGGGSDRQSMLQAVAAVS